MRLEKGCSVIVIILLLFMISSCAEGGSNLIIEISPPDKSLIDLATTVYNEEQLMELTKFDGSLNELNAKYPIECLREDNGTYRVSYLGNGYIAVILFDNSGNKLLGTIHRTQLIKSDFDVLTEGQLTEEVKTIDPHGEYLFLSSGRNDTPKVSFHYTKDGYLITIEYDELNTIIRINEELI